MIDGGIGEPTIEKPRPKAFDWRQARMERPKAVSYLPGDGRSRPRFAGKETAKPLSMSLRGWSRDNGPPVFDTIAEATSTVISPATAQSRPELRARATLDNGDASIDDPMAATR